ncbi:hypothetical protein Cni_G23566 [Canna indica]|uniref:Fe2OG dioxygenase domain-containing protein n=1 Tax=Canna indica TaxID=4628 RepID=A0AAQ3KUB9_9LILI|nr:hypothetical protein Cni_G23566 [Canna indica]
MLRSRPAAASSLVVRSFRLSRRVFLSSSSFSKKKMAGWGNPQGFSRIRNSPRPRLSVSSGKSSFNKVDGTSKSSSGNDNANSPQVTSQSTQTSRESIDRLYNSSYDITSVKTHQTTYQRTKKFPVSMDAIRSSNSPQSGTQNEEMLTQRVRDIISRCPQSDAETTHFDICKTKAAGPVILNKSLYEINRAKRKEAQAAQQTICPQRLRPGMILLKNYISLQDQVKIIQKCRQLGKGTGGFYKPGYTDGAKLRLYMMCLGMNWDPQSRSYGVKRPVDGAESPKIPMEFINLVNGAIQYSHKFLNDEHYDALSEVPIMSPDICIVNFYEKNGRLGLHQDRDECKESLHKGLPVISFSLGDTAKFLYGDERDVEKASEVELHSGDVLIFGGSSRLIFHGVSSIIPNTAPKQVTEDAGLLPGRLNLTFRQY